MSTEHGRVLAVNRVRLGSELIGAHVAGATTLVVDDGADFDESGGWVRVGDQTVEYSDADHQDDDTAVLTLVDPLAAAADDGDPVRVWDASRAVEATEVYAEVEIEGEAGGDPIGAIVAHHLVTSLPEGIRSLMGESVRIEEDGDDWIVVDVLGVSEAAGIKFETHDAHTLTSANVTAGTVTFPLSHRPSDEAVEGYWEGIRQGPGEFTVDYDAPAVTWPLSGFEAAGDVLGVHYAYRAGIVTPETPLTADSLVGTSSAYLIPETSLLVPVNSQVGDLFVIAVAPNGTCTDPRIEGTWKHALAPAVVAYWGHLDTLDPFTILSSHGSNWGAAAMVAYRGVDVKEGWGQPVTTPGEAKEMGPSAGVAVVALWSSGTVAASTAIDSTGAYTRRAWKNEGTEGVSIFDWFPSGGTVEPNPVGSFATDGTPNFLALVTLRLKVAR